MASGGGPGRLLRRAPRSAPVGDDSGIPLQLGWEEGVVGDVGDPTPGLLHYFHQAGGKDPRHGQAEESLHPLESGFEAVGLPRF